MTVALLDGPIDSTHPYLHDLTPAWNAIAGKPQTARPTPIRRPRHATAMAGIVAGKRWPARPARRRAGRLARADPGARDAAGRSHGHDRDAAGRHRSRARPERRRQPLRPRRRHPRSAGASRSPPSGHRPRPSPRRGVERLGAVLVAAAGNDGATGGRFGTIASPAASPGWLAVGASDGRRPNCRRRRRARHQRHPDGRRRRAAAGRALARRATRRSRSCCRPVPTKSDGARAPADVVAGTDEGDFRATDGTSLVSGKAVLSAARRRPDRRARRRGRRRRRQRARALRRRRRPGRRLRAGRSREAADRGAARRPGRDGGGHAAHGRRGDDHVQHDAHGRQSRRPAPCPPSRPRDWPSTTRSSPISSRRASPSRPRRPGGQYLAESGTSVAAAQVAGVAALVQQAHPTWTPRTWCAARSSGTATAVGGDGDGPARSRPRAAAP